MNVHYDIFETGLIRYKKPVLTLGTFDGVHLGHRGLIEEVLKEAKNRSTRAVVLTFDPHPKTVISPEKAPKLLTTLTEKLKCFEEIGVEEVAVLRFDSNLAELDPVSFVREILIGKLDLGKLVIGHDHGFGRDRSGGIALLQKLGREFTFEVEVFGPVHRRGKPISSTRIRAALSRGRFDEAVRMLGHSYLLSGERMKGKGRGTKLGYPTLNLATEEHKLLPPEGVYLSRVEIGHRLFGGMTYVGTRPTFSEDLLSVEVHLLDRDDQVVDPIENGQLFHIYVEKFVRPDMRFGSPEELIEQLRKDEKNIKRLLQNKAARAGVLKPAVTGGDFAARQRRN
jgi:riboflavin kinase/FMN adenylyltransferase